MTIDTDGLSVQFLSFNSFNPSYFNPFPTFFPDAPPAYAHNMNDWLFPNSSSVNYSRAWTTSAHVDLHFVDHIDLRDDAALGVHAVDKRTPYSVVSAPTSPSPLPADDASQSVRFSRPSNLAWEAFYPNGSINPSGPIHGGLGFYMRGPSPFSSNLKNAKEVVLGYSVMFARDWEWVLGGKLPGAYGGVGDSAYHCTGGRSHDRESCFNLRLMWRSNGTGELYAYLPISSNNYNNNTHTQAKNETNNIITKGWNNTIPLLSVPPKSVQNPDFGFSVGRGAFTFKRGEWAVITQRIKLNSVSSSREDGEGEGEVEEDVDDVKADGEIEVRVNGQTVIDVRGVVLRTSVASVLQGLHVQSFFGGSKPEWASPKDQHAWFADFSGAIIGSS